MLLIKLLVFAEDILSSAIVPTFVGLCFMYHVKYKPMHRGLSANMASCYIIISSNICLAICAL